MTTPSLTDPRAALLQHRGFLTFTAILSLVLGFIAIAFPLMAGVALEILIGAFCLVSGLFDLGAALFAKQIPQRAWTAIFAVVRIAAGIVLLTFVGPGLLALTVVLGALFLVEGITAIASAFKMKSQIQGWI